jgi:hypothetical protein
MSTDVVIALRCELEALSARYPYTAEEPPYGQLGSVGLCRGHGFVVLFTGFGPGCAVDELLEILGRELPGLFDDVLPQDLAIALEGFEGGMDWQAALKRGGFSSLLGVDRQHTAWRVLFGAEPPRRARPEVSVEETQESIDAMAEALLSGESLDQLRERLKGQ